MVRDVSRGQLNPSELLKHFDLASLLCLITRNPYYADMSTPTWTQDQISVFSAFLATEPSTETPPSGYAEWKTHSKITITNSSANIHPPISTIMEVDEESSSRPSEANLPANASSGGSKYSGMKIPKKNPENDSLLEARLALFNANEEQFIADRSQPLSMGKGDDGQATGIIAGELMEMTKTIRTILLQQQKLEQMNAKVKMYNSIARSEKKLNGGGKRWWRNNNKNAGGHQVNRNPNGGPQGNHNPPNWGPTGTRPPTPFPFDHSYRSSPYHTARESFGPGTTVHTNSMVRDFNAMGLAEQNASSSSS